MALLTYTVMDVNLIIRMALSTIRAESVYQSENMDAREFILEWLNDILYLINTAGEYVPFYQALTFNLIAAQQTYTLGTDPASSVVLAQPIDTIDYINIYQSSYSYAVDILDNFGWYGTTRLTSTSGRPIQVWPNYSQNSIQLNFYPIPDQAYQCNVLYKNSVQPVTYQTQIAMPPQYRAFLYYWLAKRANAQGGYGTWTPQLEAEFVKMDTTLKSAVETDYRIRSAPPYPSGLWFYTGNIGVAR